MGSRQDSQSSFILFSSLPPTAPESALHGALELSGVYVPTPGSAGILELREATSREFKPLFESPIISLIGLRLGDEGKGRSVPEISRMLTALTGIEHPVVFVGKVNGGANSGHSVVVDINGQKITLGLNLIPTGVADKGVKHLALGGGVLADPFKIAWEGELLESYGLNLFDRLHIDMKTMVADISHRFRDFGEEESRPEPRGSTGRGISPGFEDEASFSDIRWSIFKPGNKDQFAKLMTDRLERCALRCRYEYGMSEERWSGVFDELTRKEVKANAKAIECGVFSAADFDLTRFRGTEPFTFNVQRMIDEYWDMGCRYAKHVSDVGELVRGILDSRGGHLIFEHGQALGLDKRNGSSKSRTASHTSTSEIYSSFRLRASERINVIGAAKAYETAVGAHDFPTKMDPESPLAQRLMPIEKGVTTGRQRDVGHFDAVQIGASLRWHGCDQIIVNKIDQLSYDGPWKEGNLKICVAYRSPDGKLTHDIPFESSERVGYEPMYLEFPAWHENISGVRHFADLPQAAQQFFAAAVVSSVRISQRGLKNPPPPPQTLFIGVGPGEEELINDVPPYEVLERLSGLDL